MVKVTIMMEELDMGTLRTVINTISDNRNRLNLSRNIKVAVKSDDFMLITQHGTSLPCVRPGKIL